ncbi:hypothetical protein HD554DRAFT_2141611 [Boletus coccyginus]|nr:hypothetical protein HD554DRAFT_2141611 [Boletus coccyginus]
MEWSTSSTQLTVPAFLTIWQAKYGDIVYTRLLNTDVVVLNSPSVVMELLEKRSQIYSDRPFIATIEP